MNYPRGHPLTDGHGRYPLSGFFVLFEDWCRSGVFVYHAIRRAGRSGASCLHPAAVRGGKLECGCFVNPRLRDIHLEMWGRKKNLIL